MDPIEDAALDEAPPLTSSMSTPNDNIHDIGEVAREFANRVQQELPDLILGLLQSGFGPSDQLQLECSLSTRQSARPRRVHVASLDLDGAFTSLSSAPTPIRNHGPSQEHGHSPISRTLRTRSAPISPRLAPTDHDSGRPPKRRKATGALRIGSSAQTVESPSEDALSLRLNSDRRVFPQRKKAKKIPANPVLQPSTLQKFIAGVWESLFSGLKLDPTEVIEQWQAIESSGQPKLLTDTEQELSLRDQSAAHTLFGRMNILTRKISQTSRTFRSLEVIVQAHWVQCFDNRVQELAQTTTCDKAKKACVAEACVDFSWSEKELRNKMAIWRGYHDIKSAGGWAALVFARMGLYRFCKYRIAFTDETFSTLRSLQHRFEVTADTLHPRWRQLLGIIGESSERKYHGHPHDWVVDGPNNEAIPLAETYKQWDPRFEYTHLAQSLIDEDAWGPFDPRSTSPEQLTHVSSETDLFDDSRIYTCEVCNARQSNDLTINACTCFPGLYGGTQADSIPVQVYRTPNGRNNGLIACANFARGTGIGEFVGLITSGLSNMDVMIGSTPRATYQIWQGRQGNHTRFINHSCVPNSQYERFDWMGTQRIVLVSKGIEAGEEVTVDYSDVYWENLDKECLCDQPRCRYRNRSLQKRGQGAIANEEAAGPDESASVR